MVHDDHRFPSIILSIDGESERFGILNVHYEQQERGKDYTFYSLRISENIAAIKNIFTNVLTCTIDILSTLSLFLQAMDSNDRPLEYRFFDAARAFERVHALTHSNGGLVDKDIHKGLIVSLLLQVPKSLPSDYIDRLTSSLQYSNSLSFKSKLRSFINASLAKQLFPNDKSINDFLKRVTNSRNAIAHYTPIPDIDHAANSDDIEALFRICDLLYLSVFAVIEFRLQIRYGAGIHFTEAFLAPRKA